MYAALWTVASLAFFVSPGKIMLRKQLEARQGKADASLVQTNRNDSIASRDPILGISRDLEEDLSEAVDELKAEVVARQKKQK